MSKEPKPRKPGRPKLPKGEGKDKLVALRLSPDTHKRVSAAAQAQSTTVSDWIRTTLEASLNG